MKVTIFLDGDSYECLLKHVGRQALSRTVIDATVQLGNTRVVDCDDVEARDLLGKARSECPGAVRRITEAMLSAGLSEPWLNTQPICRSVKNYCAMRSGTTITPWSSANAPHYTISMAECIRSMSNGIRGEALN